MMEESAPHGRSKAGLAVTNDAETELNCAVKMIASRQQLRVEGQGRWAKIATRLRKYRSSMLMK